LAGAGIECWGSFVTPTYAVDFRSGASKPLIKNNFHFQQVGRASDPLYQASPAVRLFMA
jgi:hypothetical protein